MQWEEWLTYQLCLHLYNSMNYSPNDLIQTRQESAEPRKSSDIKYVYIHKGEIFLILKISNLQSQFSIWVDYKMRTRTQIILRTALTTALLTAL